MTVNEFKRRIQAKVSMLSTGDIPIKFNGKDIECVIELIENRKGYYINIKQPTKDLALTWEDIASIIRIMFDYHMETGSFNLTDEALCKEVLKRFNEQRKK